jgi:N4-gp56 family major capsid protein
MATTSYGVNNALAVKLWSKVLIREALKATFVYKFMGEDDSALLQRKSETSKGAGDRITVGLRMQLSGDGVQGDGTLEGNEEALVTYSDNLYIDQLRNAVRSAGKMSEQRVPFSVRAEAMAGLRDWWAGRIDTCFFNQIAGYTPQADTRYTGNQATIAPSSGNILVQGQSAESSLTSSDTFVLGLIDSAVTLAKTMTPVIRPLKVDGEDRYVAFLHPYQVRSLRTSTSTGQWLDIQKAAMTGGEVSNNPIFSGALGMYNGVILHEATRLPAAVQSGAAKANTKRAVFCGAQAALFATGQEDNAEKPNWVEQLFDYGNQLGVSGGMIFGVKKAVFNSADFGTIVLSSYAAAPS